VGEEWVIRFPKRARVAESARKEIRLMPELAKTLPVAVPDFALAAPNGALDYPWPISGYRLVPGVPLAEFDRDKQPSDLTHSVSRFLSALHAFPVNRASNLGVPGGAPGHWRDEYRRWLDEMREMIWPRLAPREQRAVAVFVEDFLGDDRNFTFTPVLLHRDLGEDHLLLDPGSGVLTGVIDFEDGTMGDPAFDFNGVINLGPGVLEGYSGPRDGGFGRRIRFYRRLWPLHEMHYGIEAGLAGHVEAGYAALRADLKANAGRPRN
jgi:aminoglycoside phosphotransferase (APT) family kinase protein